MLTSQITVETLSAPGSAAIRDLDFLGDELAVLHERLGDVVHRRVGERDGVLVGGADHESVVAVEREDVSRDLEHGGDAPGRGAEGDAGGELADVRHVADVPGVALLRRLDGLNDVARPVGNRDGHQHLMLLARLGTESGGDAVLQSGEAVEQRTRLAGSEH